MAAALPAVAGLSDAVAALTAHGLFHLHSRGAGREPGLQVLIVAVQLRRHPGDRQPRLVQPFRHGQAALYCDGILLAGVPGLGKLGLQPGAVGRRVQRDPQGLADGLIGPLQFCRIVNAPQHHIGDAQPGLEPLPQRLAAVLHADDVQVGFCHLLILGEGLALPQEVDALHACAGQQLAQFAVRGQLAGGQHVDVDLPAPLRLLQHIVDHGVHRVLVRRSGVVLDAAQVAACVGADGYAGLGLHLVNQQLPVGGQQRRLTACCQVDAAGMPRLHQLRDGLLDFAQVAAGDEVHLVQAQEGQPPLFLQVGQLLGPVAGAGHSPDEEDLRLRHQGEAAERHAPLLLFANRFRCIHSKIILY